MANYFCYLGNGTNNIIGPKFFEKYCYDKKNSENPDSGETIFSLGNLPIGTAVSFSFRRYENDLIIDVYFHAYEKKPGVWKEFLENKTLTYHSKECITFNFETENESKILLIDYQDNEKSILNINYWNSDYGFNLGSTYDNYFTLNRDSILADYDSINYTNICISRVSETAFLITGPRET